MDFPPVDPLKIYYFVLHPDQDAEDMSPFSGFGAGWTDVDWALQALAELPADVLEGGAPIDPLISQRVGGIRSIDWTPLMIGALETLKASDMGLFVVAFTGDPDVATRLEAWRAAQTVDLLHVTSTDVEGALHLEDLDPAAVIAHCREVYARRRDELDEGRQATAGPALAGWAPRTPEPVNLRRWGHNVVLPNQMSLLRAGRELESGGPFVGRDQAEYDGLILESARAVIAARDRAGLRRVNRMSLIHPEVYLVEPAFFRQAYARPRSRGTPEQLAASQVVRMFQVQRDFLSRVPSEFAQLLMEPGLAQGVAKLRADELRTFSVGIGLAAAQTTSAVVRLSPAINHVFPALGRYAQSIRSGKIEHRLKQPRLFADIGAQLAAALGPDRLAFIENEVTGPIKIVSDAPVEWLPIRGLPLMMRLQTSRLNATPGNLLMGELARNTVITLTPETVRDVLVVTALKPGDPLRNVMRVSIEAMRQSWEGKVRVTFVEALSADAFVAALNAFRGAILLFDGHGIVDDGNAVGRLVLGDETIDVWSLRGRVRVPPIVLLSACDTQGLDSPSHATAGNGFLALGATTVLATLLPVGGWTSGQFIGRLIYRLADFIPAALSAGLRVLNWTEVVWGMQRMYLASEILEDILGPLNSMEGARARLQTASNNLINSGEPDWFEQLVGSIGEHRGEPEAAVIARVGRVIARSEAIRYVQLGHPENILIDDGSIRAAIVPEHLLHYGEVGGERDEAPLGSA